MRLSSKSIATPLLAALLLTGLSAIRSAADDAPAQGFGTIAGMVMGMDGKPAAGVTVNLWTPRPKKATTDIGDRTMGKKSKAAGGKNAPVPIATTPTGADGSFTMPNIAAGSYGIDVGTKNDPAGYDHKNVTVTDGQKVTVQLALKLPTTRKSS